MTICIFPFPHPAPDDPSSSPDLEWRYVFLPVPDAAPNAPNDLPAEEEESLLDQKLTLPTDQAIEEFLQEDVDLKVSDSQLTDEEFSWLQEGLGEQQQGEGGGVEQAATKIQAAFRGYKVRKDQQSSSK